MQAITIEIPDEIVKNYHTIDNLKQVIYDDFVAFEYQKGNISIREGVEMLGITYEQFMVDFLGKRKIPFINGNTEELELEYQQEDNWLNDILRNKI